MSAGALLEGFVHGPHTADTTQIELSENSGNFGVHLQRLVKSHILGDFLAHSALLCTVISVKHKSFAIRLQNLDDFGVDSTPYITRKQFPVATKKSRILERNFLNLHFEKVKDHLPMT